MKGSSKTWSGVDGLMEPMKKEVESQPCGVKTQ